MERLALSENMSSFVVCNRLLCMDTMRGERRLLVCVSLGLYVEKSSSFQSCMHAIKSRQIYKDYANEPHDDRVQG